MLHMSTNKYMHQIISPKRQHCNEISRQIIYLNFWKQLTHHQTFSSKINKKIHRKNLPSHAAIFEVQVLALGEYKALPKYACFISLSNCRTLANPGSPQKLTALF